jgi:hypothetical protein
VAAEGGTLRGGLAEVTKSLLLRHKKHSSPRS